MPELRIPLVEQIEALLPQTQCGKCKHPGCRPYAEAMAAGEAINHCVPGGSEVIAELAVLLGKPVSQLDPAYGVEQAVRTVAFIREAECIGCTKCIQACPVDAIVGAAKHMHTVIVDDCTGCDLCVAPCPVDCIDMIALPKVTDAAERKSRASILKRRYEARNARLMREAHEKTAQRQLPSPTSAAASPSKPADNKSLVIAAALARTNLKKAERRLAEAETSGTGQEAALAEVQSCRKKLHDLEATMQTGSGPE